MQRLPPTPALDQKDSDEHHRPLRHLDLRQHRDVVRALRDHRRVARGRAVHQVDQRGLQPHLGRLGHHGGQLRLVLHVVPALREELPGRLDLRGEGSAAAAARQAVEGARMMALPKPLNDLFRPPPTPGVLAVFAQLDTTLDAIKKLRAAGHTDFTVYSPIPRHEIEDAGGKPVGSIPPYVVIMFEMTILFGALSTILGILLNTLFAARRAGTILYDPRFTNDRFGIFVPAGSDKAAKVESLLRDAGAEEVRRG